MLLLRTISRKLLYSPYKVMQNSNESLDPDLLKDLGSEENLVQEYGFDPDEARDAFRIAMLPPNERTEEDNAKIKAYSSRILEIGFAQLQEATRK